MRENNAQVTATKCAGWELSIRRNAQRADRATRNNKCACITSYSFPAERSSNNKWTCCAWKKRSCTTFGNCVDRTVVSSVASSSLWNLKLLDPSIVNLCGSPFGVRTLVDSQAFRVGPPPAARGSYSRGHLACKVFLQLIIHFPTLPGPLLPARDHFLFSRCLRFNILSCHNAPFLCHHQNCRTQTPRDIGQIADTYALHIR
jgi:hypothetical protein